MILGLQMLYTIYVNIQKRKKKFNLLGTLACNCMVHILTLISKMQQNWFMYLLNHKVNAFRHLIDIEGRTYVFNRIDDNFHTKPSYYAT